MSFNFPLEEESEGGLKKRGGPPPPSRAAVQLKPFDFDAAKKEFEPYRKQIEEMKTQAIGFEVVGVESNTQAVAMMGQARILSKAITGLKDKTLRPHNDFRTKVIAFAKAFSVPAEEAVSILNKKTKDFAYQELLRKRKEEKEERELAEKRQKELNDEADAAGVERVELPQTPIDKGEKVQTRTESGSSLSITLEWKGVVVDPVKVERSLCSPDQKKVDEAVKAGLRESPGIEG
ncbi:MAG: hypothetical protein JRC93_12400 [Deltaproteobacteria bacterium]|nr:hypothetical protein [Deltaproteobacteria bacterium]